MSIQCATIAGERDEVFQGFSLAVAFPQMTLRPTALELSPSCRSIFERHAPHYIPDTWRDWSSDIHTTPLEYLTCSLLDLLLDFFGVAAILSNTMHNS